MGCVPAHAGLEVYQRSLSKRVSIMNRLRNSMTQNTGADRLSLLAYEEGCDPIAEGLRESIRTTIGAVFVAWPMKTGPGASKETMNWWDTGRLTDPVRVEAEALAFS